MPGPILQAVRMRAGLARLAALALAATLAACATPQTDALIAHPPAGLPTQAEVANVPFYPQKQAYCGPASFAEMATWSGLPMTQDEAAKLVYTPGREGTLRTDIVTAARRKGRLAIPVSSLDHLLAELAHGRPVLVFQNLALDWVPDWHYAVAVGYDLRAQTITLRSGSEKRQVMELSTFEHTWNRGDDWARLLLRPGELPVQGGPDDVLAETAELERLGQRAAAAKSYHAVIGHWPDAALAWFGLGNIHLADGDAAAAETAYRKAIAIRPKDPRFWNNLAYALDRRGDHDAAIKAAERAVRLAGDDKTYADTLHELKAHANSGATPPA